MTGRARARLLPRESGARGFDATRAQSADQRPLARRRDALQGGIDPTDIYFWQWAAPVIGGILFAAGPAFATIRRREAGITATDETPR